MNLLVSAVTDAIQIRFTILSIYCLNCPSEISINIVIEISILILNKHIKNSIEISKNGDL